MIFKIFKKTTEKFDKFLPKNMKGVEIIKIKTMPYTTTIYTWLYGLFNVFKDISLMIWPLFRSLGRNLSIFRWFFGKFKKSKRHSEIIWPLDSLTSFFYILFCLVFNQFHLCFFWFVRIIYSISKGIFLYSYTQA